MFHLSVAKAPPPTSGFFAHGRVHLVWWYLLLSRDTYRWVAAKHVRHTQPYIYLFKGISRVKLCSYNVIYGAGHARFAALPPSDWGWLAVALDHITRSPHVRVASYRGYDSWSPRNYALVAS